MTDQPAAHPNDLYEPDWWQGWRRSDYSWAGLATKPWRGWRWDPAAEKPAPDHEAAEHLPPATLQHQWWGHRDVLFTDPHDGRAYTVAHLPRQWSDGSPSPKIQDDLWQEVSRQTDRAIQDLVDRWTGVLDLSGIVTSDDGPLTLVVPADRPASLEMNTACWSRSLLIRGPGTDPARLDSLNILSTWFLRDLDMEGARIDGRTSIILGRASECAGDLNLSGVEFGDRATLRLANRRRTLFCRAVFRERAVLEDCVFYNVVDFVDARFEGPTLFSRTTFGDVEFNSASFGASATFADTTFRRAAWFDHAAFAGSAIFHRAVFGGRASFAGAAFGSDLILEGAHFESDADFSGRAALATDRNPQTISLSIDSGPAGSAAASGDIQAADLLAAFARRSLQTLNATGAVFMRDVDFSNRDILQPSTFAGVRFLGDVRFHGGRLHQRVVFHDARFEVLDYEDLPAAASRVGGVWPDVAEALIDAQRRIDRLEPLRAFDDAPHHRALIFDEARAEREALRREAVAFQKTPDGLRQTDARLEALEASYRTLKLAMEDTRARLSESRFFKMELRARRRRRDSEVPAWERFASHAYGATADYGDSISRPIWWFMAACLVFTLVYWVLVALETGAAPSATGLGEALRYSLSRMTPFGAMAEDGAWAWLDRWRSHGSLFSWAGLIRITATIQSSLALVLTFLFALAVRRRFQIV